MDRIDRQPAEPPPADLPPAEASSDARGLAQGSASRVVRVLEALSEVRQEGAGVREVAARAGLAAATVHRILADLEAMGLAYRSADRRHHPNFVFDRQVALAGPSMTRARAVAEALGRGLGIASEIVVPRGDALAWHAKFEPPDQSIRLRAHAGFVRSIYELDAISRLALAHRPAARVEAECDLAAFYETGVAGRRLSWAEARGRIAGERLDGVAHDMQGNSKGVRRFAVAVRDGEAGDEEAGNGGALACLLTAVEAAIPLRDPAAHRERITAALIRARDDIERPGRESPGDTRMGGRS